MRNGERFQHHPSRLRDRLELIEQARLADSRVGHRCDNLPLTGLRLLRRVLQRIHLGLPADKFAQPAARRALKTGAQRSESGHFVDFDRLHDAFDP